MASASQTRSRTILIAVDASQHSKHAFDWALEQIYQPDDTIVIVHIPETPELPSLSFKDGFNVPFEEWKKLMEESRAKVESLQNDYEGDLIAKKIKHKVIAENFKNIGEAIVRESVKEKADLIIVGSRGLGKIKRTFLGSVSDHVVHHSSVPVLVCPPQKE